MGALGRFERWWLGSLPHRLHIRRYVPHFLRACPEPFRGEVLEVGAGSGWTSQRILETFPQVELTATDLDNRAVKSYERLEAQYGQRLKVKQADILALPFDRNAFDIVVATHALHHVDTLTEAIQELLRVLRPGGLLGVADEDQRFVIGPLRWLWPVSSEITRERLEEVCRQEGAEVLVAQGDVHFVVWVRKPYPVVPTESRA